MSTPESSGPTARPAAPLSDCPSCPRLVAFRAENAATYPDWHNAPVPSFGDLGSRLLIVGLAPGLRGANRTGRPFTGDFAGDLLYETLTAFGFARGRYAARPDDGFVLVDCRVTNAVRCLPPANKPVGAEIANCRPYLAAEMAAMANLRVVVALGVTAHKSVLAALGLRQSARPFAHAAVHEIVHEVAGTGNGTLLLADSYHCSRYNTNTRRLTPEMFHAVFADIRDRFDRG